MTRVIPRVHEMNWSLFNQLRDLQECEFNALRERSDGKIVIAIPAREWYIPYRRCTDSRVFALTI